MRHASESSGALQTDRIRAPYLAAGPHLTFLDIRTDDAASFGGPRSRSRCRNTHRICQAAHVILRIWKVEFPVSSLAQREGIRDTI